MIKMDKERMQRGLARTETLAKGSVLQRMWAAPLRYILAQGWRRLGYPLLRRGWAVTATPFYGGQLKIRLPAAMDIYLIGGKSHPSEIRLAHFLLQHLRLGDRFVDIGAHVGYFAALAHHLTGPTGRVDAYEAAPDTFELLQANLAALPGCVAHHRALAARSGHLVFYTFPVQYSEYNSLDISAYQQEAWFRANPPKAWQIPTETLDTLWEAGPEPAVIKIDAEGAEDQIIAGGQAHLPVFEGCLVLEYIREGLSGGGHRRAWDQLLAWGYRPHRIDEGGNLLVDEDPEAYLIQTGLESDNWVFYRSTKV